MQKNNGRVVRFIRLEDGRVMTLEKTYFSLKRSQKEYIGKRFTKYFKLYLQENKFRMPSRNDLKDEIFPLVWNDVKNRGVAISKENLWIYMYQFTHKLLQNYYPEFRIGPREEKILLSYGCKIKSLKNKEKESGN